MKTYQDFLACEGDEKKIKAFILEAITEFKDSDDYKMADTAEKYYKNLNPDIMNYEKWVYDANGLAHRDTISPNHKIPQNYFFMLVSQTVSYCLANGVAFEDKKIKDKLGANFDGTLKKILTDAIISKRSWGFYHDNKVDFIPYKQFIGLPDEYDSSIRSGIWFFQIDDKKPLNVRLYEEDGYTEYVQEVGKGLEIKTPKRAYKIKKVVSEFEAQVYDYENYPSFPVVPLDNINQQSAIVGVLNILKALDLMYSKLINNVSEGDVIYWILQNYGGMTEDDDNKFLVNLLKTHVLHVEGEGSAQPHQMEIPFEASDAAIAQLKKLLFDGMMGVDVEKISAGNETATAIRAAYENLNIKEGLIEYEIIEFIHGIFRVAGIDENTEFHLTPNKIVNLQEELLTIASIETLIGNPAATMKACELLGMIDKYDDIQEEKAKQALETSTLET